MLSVILSPALTINFSFLRIKSVYGVKIIMDPAVSARNRSIYFRKGTVTFHDDCKQNRALTHYCRCAQLGSCRTLLLRPGCMDLRRRDRDHGENNLYCNCSRGYLEHIYAVYERRRNSKHTRVKKDGASPLRLAPLIFYLQKHSI